LAGITAVSGVFLAHPLEHVAARQRAAMEWAREETSRDATFAVLGYFVDGGTVEWFPALSERRNLTTWQGSEWHADRHSRDEAAGWADCRMLSCLPRADYYVVRPGCCSTIAEALHRIRDDVYVSETETTH